MSIQYNALEYAQQLEAAGVPKAQAEVHASMLGRVISDCVAVPADLHPLRSDLTHQLVETETRLRAEIKGMETRLRAEIAETEARLSAKIDIGLERLSSRIDKLEDAMGYLKWMNALTLALLLGLIVKSSFA
jgi:uncharacterized protein YgfB (UPF0149 family)